MLDRDRLTRAAASFKRSASREFDEVVRALIELGFRHAGAGADFLWDMSPGLREEAMAICRGLSDTLADKAKAIARGVVEDALSDYDFDEAWDRDDGRDGFAPILTRLDQEGSHLLELLEIWLALAFLNRIRKGELVVLVSRFLSNPFASPLWRGLPKDILKWGRGYSVNILDQIGRIGQDAIVASARYAEWQDAREDGAVYYIRRRGSGYDCPECDDLCGYPIPIDEPFVWLHSRCMCWPEYHFEPMPS